METNPPLVTTTPEGDNMLVRIGLLKKKPNWRTEEFRAHWVSRHGPLAQQLSGLRGYVQNHVVAREHGAFDFPRGTEEFDGFSQLWFDDEASMRAAVATDLGRALVADEGHFIGELRIALVRQDEIIAPENGRSCVKLMCLLRRRPEIGAEQFQEEWGDPRRSPIGTIPGVRGIRQNMIVGREVPKGSPAGYERLPIDAIVELWFDGAEALASAFSSSEGRQMIARYRDLVAEITPFLVEPYVVV
jgi:uncharacterized protein (TIGR02118 family)